MPRTPKGMSIINRGVPHKSKHMKNSRSFSPFQSLFSRFSEELKDALVALRNAESAMEFELAVQNLERIKWELEWLGELEGA